MVSTVQHEGVKGLTSHHLMLIVSLVPGLEDSVEVIDKWNSLLGNSDNTSSVGTDGEPEGATLETACLRDAYPIDIVSRKKKNLATSC